MIRYESDERAVARVLAALGDGETIDHGTARTIASWFTDGADTVNYAFVSTGTMPSDTETPGVDILHTMYRGVDQATRDANNDALLALDYYLEEREASGDLGRIPGWSDMWVRKHVDRPHEDGTLPECWCADNDDDD